MSEVHLQENKTSKSVQKTEVLLNEEFESALREIGVEPENIHTYELGPRRDIGGRYLV